MSIETEQRQKLTLFEQGTLHGIDVVIQPDAKNYSLLESAFDSAYSKMSEVERMFLNKMKKTLLQNMEAHIFNYSNQLMKDMIADK